MPRLTAVTIGGEETEWDVHVGLSGRIEPIEGRMKFEADEVRPSGGGKGRVELGDAADPVSQAFERGEFDFFQTNPDALGLPVAWQLRFVKRDDGSSDVVFPEGIVSAPLVVREIDGVWYLVAFPQG